MNRLQRLRDADGAVTGATSNPADKVR